MGYSAEWIDERGQRFESTEIESAIVACIYKLKLHKPAVIDGL
jgi:hypothetical protein